MADITKPKLQLRSGLSFNGDQSPSPATKLLLNHGKPNFTIQRSPKADENEDANPFQGLSNNNNNYNPYKSANVAVKTTMFNQPSKLTLSQTTTNGENEASKVVLRRAKVPELPKDENEDESVPEFIRRQRRIQERLAKEDLDFENRRSGYFTHVVISPTSANRPTSFMETMSSPAVVPALEIPAPTAERSSKTIQEEETFEAVTAVPVLEEIKHEKLNAQPEVHTNGLTNGNGYHEEVEEEAAQIEKAIEEVNKAVAGEDDEPAVSTTTAATAAVENVLAEAVEIVEEKKTEQQNEKEAEVVVEHQQPVVAAVTTSMLINDEPTAAEQEVKPTTISVNTETENKTIVETEKPLQNGHAQEAPLQNGNAEPQQLNGHASTNGDDIVISHTNGGGPSIPNPDPSGALGVNYEPKTVTSFSQELGSEPNKYPDTVKVAGKEGGEPTAVLDEQMQDLAKLKFDIKADEQDVQVTPVLRAE